MEATGKKKGIVELLLLWKTTKAFTEGLPTKKPSYRSLLLANRQTYPCCCATISLVFHSLHICFTASGTPQQCQQDSHQKEQRKNQSQCTARTSESLDEKEITISCNHRPAGILEKVSKVNKVLISFISKSVIKHHGVQNSLAVNSPTEIVGTVILALQHYPMLCAFLQPSEMNVCLAQGCICLSLPKCTCWGYTCMNAQKASYQIWTLFF